MIWTSSFMSTFPMLASRPGLCTSVELMFASLESFQHFDSDLGIKCRVLGSRHSAKRTCGTSGHVSGRNATCDSVSDMDVAVLVHDGVFDSGLAAILDVLDNANAMGEEISEPPIWNVTTVATQPVVRTGAGHLVDCKPLERAETADLLMVAARGRSPGEVLGFVSGDQSL